MTLERLEEIKTYCLIQKKLDDALNDGIRRPVRIPYRDVLLMLEEIEREQRGLMEEKV